MDRYEAIPTALKVVAWLFILSGVTSAIEIVLSLFVGRISINFGVLGIPIGWGLLHLSQSWRSLAIILLAIGVIGLPLIALLFLGAGGPVSFSVFGYTNDNAPKGLALLVFAVIWAITAWELSVLTRRDVRELFELGPQS